MTSRASPPRVGSVELRESIRARASNRPGVYRIYGKDSELIYVGKSVRVRTRLLSYFRASEGEKAHRVMEVAEGAEWNYTPDEFSALVEEMKLIRSHRPRFNVQHKRKRAHAFVKITRERAPRILSVSKVVRDGSCYYGPFPRVEALHAAVRELVHTLGIRSCPARTPVQFSDQSDLFGWKVVPGCIRAELGSCLAPCSGRSSESEYLDAVETARRFLSGSAEDPLAKLRSAMRQAAGREEFEYAALLRDRHDRLRRFADELTAFRGELRELSFIYRVEGYDGVRRLYLIRGGRVRKRLPEPSAERKASQRLAGAIREVFGGKDWGPARLRPADAAEILLVARWFRLRPEELANTTSPEAWLRAERDMR